MGWYRSSRSIINTARNFRCLSSYFGSICAGGGEHRAKHYPDPADVERDIVPRRNSSASEFELASCGQRNLGRRGSRHTLFSWLCLAAGPVADAYKAPELQPVLICMGLGLLPSGINGVKTALLRRNMQFARIAARSLIGRLVGAAVGLSAGFAGFGIWAIVWQLVATNIVVTITLWGYRAEWPTFHFSWRSALQLARISIPSSAANFLLQANLRLFLVAVGYILGSTAAGQLSVALRIVDTARTILGTALHQLAFPLFVRKQGDQIGLSRGFREATELTCLITLPMFAGLLAVADHLVPIVLGTGWPASAMIIRILCIVAMVQMARLYSTAAIVAGGRPGLLVWQNVSGLVVSLGLVYIFGNYGVVAVAFLWTIRTLIVTPINIITVKNVSNIGYADQLAPVLNSAVSSVIMAALLCSIDRIWLNGLSDRMSLLIMICTGFFVYVLLAIAFDRTAVARVRGFVAMMVTKG